MNTIYEKIIKHVRAQEDNDSKIVSTFINDVCPYGFSYLTGWERYAPNVYALQLMDLSNHCEQNTFIFLIENTKFGLVCNHAYMCDEYVEPKNKTYCKIIVEDMSSTINNTFAVSFNNKEGQPIMKIINTGYHNMQDEYNARAFIDFHPDHIIEEEK